MKSAPVLFLFATLLLGCALSPKYTDNGIPDARYLLGGGEVYKGIAPKDGTFIVVEQTSQKILSTRPVKKGKDLYYQIQEETLKNDPKGFKKKYGIPFSKARFRAYFIPGK